MQEVGATKMQPRIVLAVRQSVRAAMSAGTQKSVTPLIVGVSGGVDSVCLIHILAGVAASFGINPIVAHLNHQLRGDESDDDARFVAALARALGLECVVASADVAGAAAHNRQSVELAAREARYRFLGETALAHTAMHVAVAHHADDQAETLLLRIIRGTGVAGLAGMRMSAPLPCRTEPNSINLLRPLLNVTRAEIQTYAGQNGLSFRHDRSNESSDHMRNRIRHELLPMLEGYNPGIRKVLLHLADAAAQDNEIINVAVAAAWQACAAGNHPIRLNRTLWLAQPAGIQRALIREGVRRSLGDALDLRFAAIEEARGVILSPATHAQIALNARIMLALDRDWLTFQHAPL